MKSVDINLKTGFKYHHQSPGEPAQEVTAKFITIRAFSMKEMHHVAPIKEIVMKCYGRAFKDSDITEDDVKEAAEAKSQTSDGISEDIDPESIDASQIIAIISMNCDEGDLGKLWVYMSKLLTSGVAYIDSSTVKLSGTWINKLDPPDFENLCGEYIGNFIT